MKTLTKNLKTLITGITFALVLLISFSAVAQNPINTQNPYDYIGEIHNELLDTYKMEYKGSKKSVKEAYVIFNNLLKNNSTARDYKVKTRPINEEHVNLLENGAYHFKNDFQNLIQGLKTSEIAKNEITILKDYIFKTCIKEGIGFEDFYSHLVKNEDRILKNKKLTNIEKKLILGSYSTARHSYAYWLKNDEVTGERRGFWGTFAIIVGDVAGWFATTSIDGAGAASEIVADTIDGK